MHRRLSGTHQSVLNTGIDHQSGWEYFKVTELYVDDLSI